MAFGKPKCEELACQEDIIHALDELPKDIQRSLVDLTYLDQTYQDMHLKLVGKRYEHLRRLMLRPPVENRMHRKERHSARRETDKLYMLALNKCEEKMKITRHMCDMLSSHIVNLDAQLNILGEPACGSDDARRRRQFEGSGLLGSQGLEYEFINPNEPKYCICNRISFGEMIACDNDYCPTEWFHFPCVGIAEHPAGKWYCPDCIISRREDEQRMRRRSSISTLGIHYPGYKIKKKKTKAVEGSSPVKESAIKLTGIIDGIAETKFSGMENVDGAVCDTHLSNDGKQGSVMRNGAIMDHIPSDGGFPWMTDFIPAEHSAQ